MLGNYDLIPLIPPVKIFLGKFLFLPQPPSLLGNFPFWLIMMASLRQLTIIWGWPQRSKGSRRSAWAPVTTLHSPRNWVPVAPNSVFFYCNSHESLVRTPVSTSIKAVEASEAFIEKEQWQSPSPKQAVEASEAFLEEKQWQWPSPVQALDQWEASIYWTQILSTN